MSVEKKYIDELEVLTRAYLSQGKGSRVKRYKNAETGTVRKVLSYRHKQVSRMKDFLLFVARTPKIQIGGSIKNIGARQVNAYLVSLELSDYEIQKRWEAIRVLYKLLGRVEQPPRPR